jgi:hypothetical protein
MLVSLQTAYDRLNRRAGKYSTEVGKYRSFRQKIP